MIRVLCACDLLNEGWDCPDVEVLLMARPTLSKVIYLQQLGRGTRKAPGKECLVVFDFVDNATRYNQSLSLHRILGNPHYRPGALVLAPPELLSREQEALDTGKPPTQILPIDLWVRDYEEINVFDWQDAVAGMLSASDLEVELAAAEGRIRGAIARGRHRARPYAEPRRADVLLLPADRVERSARRWACPGSMKPRSGSCSSTSPSGWTCPARTSR